MTQTAYSRLEDRAFWRKAVAEASPLAPGDIYRPKWPIAPGTRIATAGSCFAQHVARALRGQGRAVLDMEPAPAALPQGRREEFGYGLYSARYGNLYSARQFRQLLEEAVAEEPPAPLVWTRGGRLFDALRPAIEPGGFASEAELREARAWHLAAVRRLIAEADLWIFTLGLTESWIHEPSGRVVPTAPGVIAGAPEPEDYAFANLSYNEIVTDFRAAMQVIQARRKRPARFLLTVSPVPLTATASGGHVLPATAYSKAVLRAAAGLLAEQHAAVDYFPSYEIVTNPAARGVFFAPNLRSVTPAGVEVVMRSFLAAHPAEDAAPPAEPSGTAEPHCEEALLEAFA